ncbi:ArsR/SmtB family transcription factor [Solitalea lacus]|uniref:ArsR/SmtB family transcription factor n=1 Tax=Solitalea lacus TaxID=2911172 RepID=UPI001EDA14B4|nr:metalloregulator ArsR/SmtB family transcription factor [Solitalea lacus]UKJ06263.1 metalloregulator ArsR/SmtB family transcription factor [Solitalea lacus]
MDKKIFQLHADVCKALGNPLRIEVINLLENKELCFTDLLEITGGLKSNLSQHLSVMTKKGILKVRREGQCNYYSLASLKVAQACRLMREVLIENLKNQKELLEKL